MASQISTSIGDFKLKDTVEISIGSYIVCRLEEQGIGVRSKLISVLKF